MGNLADIRNKSSKYILEIKTLFLKIYFSPITLTDETMNIFDEVKLCKQIKKTKK